MEIFGFTLYAWTSVSLSQKHAHLRATCLDPVYTKRQRQREAKAAGTQWYWFHWKQETWAQEAYRQLYSKCSGEGTYLVQGDVPTLGYPLPPVLTWPGGVSLGYPPPSWPGHPPGRGGRWYLPTLEGGRGIYLGQGVPTLPRVPLPPPRCEQTDTCENSTLPSYYVRGR